MMRKITDVAFLSVCALVTIGSTVAVAGNGTAHDLILKVPEPGTLAIFGLGIGALYLISRHKRRK